MSRTSNNGNAGRHDESSDERDSQPKQPPPPPEMERKLKFYPYQWITIPLMILLPLLAMTGILDNYTDQITSGNDTLQVQISYPARTMYRTRGTIIIDVRNLSDNTLTGLTVSVDRSFLTAFGDVQFTPDDLDITDTAYILSLDNLPSGATQRITVHYEPDHYWQHSGTLTADAAEAAPVQVNLTTFVLP